MIHNFADHDRSDSRAAIIAGVGIQRWRGHRIEVTLAAGPAPPGFSIGGRPKIDLIREMHQVGVVTAGSQQQQTVRTVRVPERTPARPPVSGTGPPRKPCIRGPAESCRPVCGTLSGWRRNYSSTTHSRRSDPGRVVEFDPVGGRIGRIEKYLVDDDLVDRSDAGVPGRTAILHACPPTGSVAVVVMDVDKLEGYSRCRRPEWARERNRRS